MLAQKQPPFKECVTAYWSMCPCADNVRGLKPITEARECGSSEFLVLSSELFGLSTRNSVLRTAVLVGECSQCGEAVGVSPGGALGSTDAGISSEKTGENPVRRKPKGS